MFIYYRNDTGRDLYRVEALDVPEAPGGGMDLTEVPAGDVTKWDGSSWLPAELPEVGHGPGLVCHTKNVAGIGV